jgi:iron complex outermembrane receptor protein
LGDLALYKEQAVKLSTTLQKNGLLSRLRLTFLNSIRNFMFLRPVGFETTIRGAFPCGIPANQ